MYRKVTTYDVGNPGIYLGQTQKCGRVKPFNVPGDILYPSPLSCCLYYPLTQ